MNTAHLHLLLVHIPIIMTPIAAVLIVIGSAKQQEILNRVAYALLLISGLTAGAALYTGDAAEEIVEDLPGVSESAIEAHEEASETTVYLSLATFLVALAALALRNRPVGQKLNRALVVCSCISSLALAYSGYLGGKIRHPEAYSTVQSGTMEEIEDHDD